MFGYEEMEGKVREENGGNFPHWITITQCLDKNFGEKRKNGEGKEGKRYERKVTIVSLGGKGRNMRVFPPNLFNFGDIKTLTKIIHIIRSNSFAPILLSK